MIHRVQLLSLPGTVPWWGQRARAVWLLFYAAASPLLPVWPMWQKMSGSDGQYLVLLMPLNNTEDTRWISLRVMKTLESPLHCKIKPVNPEGNQGWIFIGRNNAEVELQYFGRLISKSQLIGKDPDVGKIKGKRRSGWQRKRWLDSITDSMDMNLSNLREIVEDRGAWRATVHGVTKSRTWLSRWTTMFTKHFECLFILNMTVACIKYPPTPESKHISLGFLKKCNAMFLVNYGNKKRPKAVVQSFLGVLNLW